MLPIVEYHTFTSYIHKGLNKSIIIYFLLHLAEVPATGIRPDPQAAGKKNCQLPVAGVTQCAWRHT